MSDITSGTANNTASSTETQQAFLASDRPHILMITNHGIHQWNVVPGLPDTGGQNVFVNMFTDMLAEMGFRVTITNRGGYAHPTTGEMHTGMKYRDDRRRILYVEDETKEFVRKEDMDVHTESLATNLLAHLDEEGIPVDLIISHYWDAAKIGVLVNRELPKRVPHVWVPHSVGALKKLNMSPDTWADLRVDERIAVEKTLVPELDGIAATSSRIQQSLREDYGYVSDLFLPPCVDIDRFHERVIPADHEVWEMLAGLTDLSVEEVRGSRIITEISRTDRTKRKDVLMRAFAHVLQEAPDALLVVSVDDTEQALSDELRALADELGIAGRTAAVGNIWDVLPYLYAITSVYCSPSVMEGFGMSVQEAAATRVPVVGSNLIPFVVEYLLGDSVEDVPYDDMVDRGLQWGEGAVVVQADDVAGFALALTRLMTDETERRRMGDRAFDITVPRFTWRGMTERFLDGIGVVAPL